MTIEWLRYRRMLKVLVKLDIVDYDMISAYLHYRPE